jgi:hypothetical protein
MGLNESLDSTLFPSPGYSPILITNEKKMLNPIL